MKTQFNKKFTRRDFLRLSAVTTTGALLAACGGAQAPAPAPKPEEKPKEEPKKEEPAAPAPAAEKITLRMWSHNNPAFVKSNELLVKKWQESKPNVEIKYENFPYDQFIQTIQTSMAAKNEADVMEMFGSWVQTYAKGKTLAEAPDAVVSMANAKELFYAAPLDGYIWEGKLYGLPNEYNLENGAVLVNKTKFEEAKIKFPPDWQSWDALVADAKQMTKMDGSTMTVAGFNYVTNDGLGFLYWEGVLERGADYFAKDGIHLDFLTPAAEDTVQWLVNMAQKDKVVDPVTFNANVNWVGDSFFQSLVAIGFIGPWIVPVAHENHPDFADKWEYVTCPHYGDKISFAADAGWGKVVSPNSKAIETAWEFAKFNAMDQANARFWNVGTGTVPALKPVAEDPTLLKDMDWLGPSLKVLPFGRYVGMLQDRDFVWYNVVATRITEALQGQRSVKETMTLMNQEANAMIDSKLK